VVVYGVNAQDMTHQADGDSTASQIQSFWHNEICIWKADSHAHQINCHILHFTIKMGWCQTHLPVIQPHCGYWRKTKIPTHSKRLQFNSWVFSDYRDRIPTPSLRPG
jgi:hypothetical protein